ncbi:MAG: transmembrane anchor protein [Rhodobacteraceae bacterium]|nr:transmembrane anchor protein [Paracoccaceae bacterium]
MYNAEKPSVEDLPSSKQLLKSTLIALVAAVAILFTVVLPAEYGIDPTRIGRVLGLTEMGEIKTQLAEEAEADKQSSLQRPQQGIGLLDLFIGSAAAQDTPDWSDEFSFTLAPGQGAEWKLVMQAGAEAEYSWNTDQGVVNFDLHGDGSGNSTSYTKGRGVAGDVGVLKAAFTGNHGWFWRNRGKSDLTVTVRLRGDYSSVKRTY